MRICKDAELIKIFINDDSVHFNPEKLIKNLTHFGKILMRRYLGVTPEEIFVKLALEI